MKRKIIGICCAMSVVVLGFFLSYLNGAFCDASSIGGFYGTWCFDFCNSEQHGDCNQIQYNCECQQGQRCNCNGAFTCDDQTLELLGYNETNLEYCAPFI